MRVIIAGSRTVTDFETVKQACYDQMANDLWPFPWTEIVSGGASGVDRLGEKFAQEFDLPIRYFYPDWKKHGRAAGPIRNAEMAAYADALVAVWDGKSAGTADMIRQAGKAGLLVYVKTVAATRPPGSTP